MKQIKQTKIRNQNTSKLDKLQIEPSQAKMKSYGYAKDCDKREMKREIKQRKMIRKQKMGCFEISI